jgi:ankyrin repeat protein
VQKKCRKSVEYALASGVPIDLVDHAEQTPLYYACEHGYTKIVQILLEYGARHDIIDLNQTSPLWIAAGKGHDDIVLILLNKGADPNQKANDGTTALYQSSYKGHVKCAHHLVRYGGCVHYAKDSGASPIFVAARNGHHRIVKCLLKYGADPSQSQADFRSPLHTALLYNRVRCAQLLLQTNVNCLLEQRDIYGWSSLHFLAKRGNMKGARFYFHYLQIHRKAGNINEQDIFGNTALHIAILNKKRKFADYLIKKGCDIHQSNSFRWTYHKLLLKSKEKCDVNEQFGKVYFDNLLSKHLLRYTLEEEIICNEVESYVEELVSYVGKLNTLFRNTIIRSGSYYEQTRVGLPDEFDYMIDLTEIKNLCQFVEDINDPSGYGRLYPLPTKEAHEKLICYIEPITQCISSDKIRKQFYQLLTSARVHVFQKEISLKFKHLKFEWTSGDKRCGTAIHTEWYGTQYPCLSIKIDVVPCLTICSWPKTAKIKCPSDQSQFHVIARSPKADETYLWRISTSQAELILFQSLVPEQMNGYLILKSLRLSNPSTCKIDKTNYTADDLITSYMLKNEFMHEIVRYPKHQQWTNGSLIHRILGILKRLHKHLLIGSIKSFYILNYNVIDNDDYKRFRSFQIKYVQILIDQFKDQLKQLNHKPTRRHTFVAADSITKKHLLRERAVTIEKMTELKREIL